MRERLTLAFVLLTVVSLAGGLLVRNYALAGDLREQQAAQLRVSATTARVAVEQRLELDRPVDADFLTGLVAPTDQLTWTPATGEPVSVRGASFDATADQPTVDLDADGTADDAAADPGDEDDAGDADGDLVASSVAFADGRLTLVGSPDVVSDVVDADLRSFGLLLGLAAIVAALLGWLAARSLSAPFRRLADAADLLGRGRFDLDLPRSPVPEVQAISQALRGAAGRLQERLSREKEFAQHASHVLRTPLTGLRMELEELTLRDDVPLDARDQVSRSLDRIDSMDVVAGELVELSRRGSLVAGSEVKLQELATSCAQRWADTLAEHDRPLSAAVEGDLETTYTPGPVEHILDLLLADVLRRGSGPVRMLFEAGNGGNLKIKVACTGDLQGPKGGGSEVPITQARAVATALGGHLTGADPAAGLEILLPRR